MTPATRLAAGARPTLTAVGPTSRREPIRISAGKLVPGTRYEVVRWLGEGGMGVVYEAVQVDIDQRVALKILRREFCTDAAVAGMFRQEARATGQIGGDYIAQVRDFVELSDGRLMIAMEFLEGRDLHSSIRGPMEVGRIIAILRQCCRGLAAVHDHGLIHRDVKPENIFLTSEHGRPDKVKILDFGISMFVDRADPDRLVGGTPGFVAPELILLGEGGPAVDQFALGSVAYVMLTGKPAFPGGSTSDVVVASLEPPPRPTSVADGVPQSLVDIAMKCLATDPNDRFADMRELEVALCRAQIDAGIQTAWDDLPLPDVDPDLRAWLLSHMPQPEAGVLRSTYRRGVLLAFMAALGLAGVVGLAVATTAAFEDKSAADRSDVELKTAQAHDAAAKALFVYPPADDPDATTAFQIVRRLELLDEPHREAGRAAASSLRSEFAQTLSRLGSSYWEADGGRVFAIAYYEQAVLFSPSLEPAATRAQMSAERANTLADRARRGDFSSLELISAEPLQILANEDVTTRRTKFSEFRSARAKRLDTIASRLGGADSTPRNGPQDPSDLAPDSQQQDQGEEQGEVVVDQERVAAGRSVKLDAARLAREGQGAFRRGDDVRAKLRFEQALGLDTKNISALSGLRDIAFDAGQYGRAVRYGKRVVRLAPRGAAHHLRLGDAYFKVSSYELSVKHYGTASKLGAKDARSRLERARQRLPTPAR